MDDILIRRAVELLQDDQLVAIPTETVYGLAANAFSDHAVAKIYSLKKRPSFNPLIIHCNNLEMAQDLAIFNESAFKLAKAFWPGPLTLVLPLKENSRLSKLASAGLKTVALRVPAHPITLKILELSQIPLAAPSANPSESISPTTAHHVEYAFKDFKDLSLVIDGGPCQVGLESTIIDLSEAYPKLLRFGKITQPDLESLIGKYFDTADDQNIIKAPGQLKKHYAPSIPLSMNVHAVNPSQALLAFGSSPLLGAKKTLNLSPSSDLLEAAANLFAMLHELDNNEFESIAVMPIPAEGIGLAINDRLSRASSY